MGRGEDGLIEEIGRWVGGLGGWVGWVGFCYLDVGDEESKEGEDSPVEVEAEETVVGGWVGGWVGGIGG